MIDNNKHGSCDRHSQIAARKIWSSNSNKNVDRADTTAETDCGAVHERLFNLTASCWDYVTAGSERLRARRVKVNSKDFVSCDKLVNICILHLNEVGSWPHVQSCIKSLLFNFATTRRCRFVSLTWQGKLVPQANEKKFNWQCDILTFFKHSNFNLSEWIWAAPSALYSWCAHLPALRCHVLCLQTIRNNLCFTFKSSF